MEIIDVHTHIFPEKLAHKAVLNLGNYYHYEMYGTGVFEDLKKSAAEAGITKLFCHSTATKCEQVEHINTFISQFVSDDVHAFGTLHIDYKDFEKEIERIKKMGLKGIKLHPDFQRFNIDDERMFPIYEVLQDNLPVLFHLGDDNVDFSSPKRMARVLKLFPHLTVIGAHMGGYGRWDEAEEYLIGKNLYIDTSSSFLRLGEEGVCRLIKKHGADKVLFGTDYPLENHKIPLNHFLNLDLSDDDKEKILYTNAYNLLWK